MDENKKTSFPMVFEKDGEYVAIDFEMAALIRAGLEEIQLRGGCGMLRIVVRAGKAHVKAEFNLGSTKISD
ncbi:MAG: hypothetical protein AB9907_14785 [Flexilinea sp.]